MPPSVHVETVDAGDQTLTLRTSLIGFHTNFAYVSIFDNHTLSDLRDDTKPGYGVTFDGGKFDGLTPWRPINVRYVSPRNDYRLAPLFNAYTEYGADVTAQGHTGEWKMRGTATQADDDNQLGTSVSVSGSRVATGEPSYSPNKGRVVVREYNGTSWVIVGDPFPSSEFASDNDKWGWDVDIDGDRVAVAAQGPYHSTVPGKYSCTSTTVLTGMR